MEQLLGSIGIWVWWIIAAVLLIAELLVMTVFLVWLGAAALTVGLIELFVDLGWQLEVFLFVVLSTIYVLVGRRYVNTRSEPRDGDPALNQRTSAYVGRTVVLHEAIVNGQGKVKLDDALWRVEGTDAPAGSKVRIVAASAMALQTEPA
jgi:membrane protein implicated in regulation of membrane protease activity